MAVKKSKKTAKKKPSTKQEKKTVKKMRKKTKKKTKPTASASKTKVEKKKKIKKTKKKLSKKQIKKKPKTSSKKKTKKITNKKQKKKEKITKKKTAKKKTKADKKQRIIKKKKEKKLSSAEQKALNQIQKELKKDFLPKNIIDKLITEIVEKKISETRIKKIVNRVLNDYNGNQIDPSEACGIVGAQSIGEPGTQMSIPYDEKIIVKHDGKIKICQIGEFVDQTMNEFQHKIIKKSEVCDIPIDEEIFVPSLNQDEKIEWKKIISCSRHKSPKKILRLKTRSGRSIRATDAHSFVIRDKNKIIPISGKDLTIGTRIPVVKHLEENCIGSLDLRNYLDIDEMNHAFEKNDNISPYQNKKPFLKNIKLNDSLGWFTGAFLAEGNLSNYYTSISNTNEAVFTNVRNFSEQYNLSYDEFDNTHGFSWSHDIRINPSLLSSFMKKTCGIEARTKKIPEFAYSANIEYVCGLLKGYFDVDGTINVRRKSIQASSSSKDIIDGIALLLHRLGIFCSKQSNGNMYSLRISYRYAPLFLDKIGSDNKEKKEKLETLKEFHSFNHKSYDTIEMIPGFGSIFYDIAEMIGFPKSRIHTFSKRQRISRITLARYIQEFERIADEKDIDIKNQLKRLKKMLNADVIWDEIIDISYVNTDYKYVYDLSVEGLETFTTFDGVITHNTMRTFHYAGVAEINVTLGLPRLIEIVDARSKPKTPMMNIYLDEEHRHDAKKAKIVANQIEITQLQDIAEIETDLTNLFIYIKPDLTSIKNKGLSLKEIIKVMKKIRKIDVLKTKKNIIKVSLDKPSFKKLLDITEKLKTLKVKGVNGINRIIIRKEASEGYVIYSEGSNLNKVLQIPGVDPYRTTTNDIRAVGRVLGIEAERNMIIQEAHATLSEQGLNVDKRHIMLVADVMTADGKIKAIGRHGVSGEKTSVLSRAAFEITVNHLLDASRRGESDLLEGVAENIIVGQPVNLGTGAVELAMKRTKPKKKKE